MHYLKTYPFALIIVAIICYLSFFKPPQTEMNEIPYIDKLVHICMYGGLTSVIWFEYLRKHPAIAWRKLSVGGILLPVAMSGCIEILQAVCTDNRSGDWLDFLANTIGVGLACLFSYYAVYPFIKKYR